MTDGTDREPEGNEPIGPEPPQGDAPPQSRRGVGGWIATALVTAALVALIALGWTQRSRFTSADVGARAPAFTLVDLEGDSVSLEQYRGHVVLLNFWATWCPPCIHEMPSMERVWRDLRDRGFVVLGVSLDVSPGQPDAEGRSQGIVREYVDELQVTFPILLDPAGRVEAVYNVTGLPTSYVIGPDGRIEGRVVGSREWDSEEYRARFEELLGG